MRFVCRTTTLNLWRSTTKHHPPGADRLLNWLETTDFFTAPASTRFHGACECGLVMHSINVYNAMMQHFYTEGENAEAMPSAACCTTCAKANFYKGQHPQCQKRRHRPVGEGPVLPGGGSTALRPRREECLPHRAFYAAENRRGYCHPLAHGRLLTMPRAAAALLSAKPTTPPAGGQAAHCGPDRHLPDGAGYQRSRKRSPENK